MENWNKDQETEYILRFEEGYLLAKRGETKILDLLINASTPNEPVHEGWKDGKKEWELELQMVNEPELKYLKRSEELKQLTKDQNDRNIER